MHASLHLPILSSVLLRCIRYRFETQNSPTQSSSIHEGNVPRPGVNIPIGTCYMLHNAPPIAYALPHLRGLPIHACSSSCCANYGGQKRVPSFPPGSPPGQTHSMNVNGTGAGVPLDQVYVPTLYHSCSCT